jgi:hypothetical protein
MHIKECWLVADEQMAELATWLLACLADDGG